MRNSGNPTGFDSRTDELHRLLRLLALLLWVSLPGCEPADEAEVGVDISGEIDDTNYPVFPWPPPRASARERIPDHFVRRPTGLTSLGHVAQRLEEAFDSAGYGTTGFYGVPHGFALASRLEQINPSGAPRANNRFSVNVERRNLFSLRDYIQALFSANPGRYRIIVFIVTSQPIQQDTAAVTFEAAIDWVNNGTDRLPVEVAQQPYTGAHRTTAHIYEFVRPTTSAEPSMRLPSELAGRAHLEGAGLWAALGRVR